MIRLLSTDFDGTLVSHEEDPPVAPALFDLFQDLREKGVFWAVNTGRAVHHIVEGLEKFEFPFQPDFVLTAEREVFRRKSDGTEGWEDFGDWNDRCLKAHKALYEQAEPIISDIHLFLKNNTNALPINDISGVGIIASNDEEMEAIAAYIDSLRGRMPAFHYQRNSRYMRFCHAGYSKGTALAELGRLLDIPKDQIFATGDHYNDIPMLDGAYARWVACPANSVDAVKKAVLRAGGYVAKAPSSQGVVEALNFFSKQK